MWRKEGGGLVCVDSGIVEGVGRQSRHAEQERQLGGNPCDEGDNADQSMSLTASLLGKKEWDCLGGTSNVSSKGRSFDKVGRRLRE